MPLNFFLIVSGMITSTIHIAVVDDHLLFRKGIISLFSYYNELEVVIEATNGIDLFNQLENKRVDVVLLDLQMPQMDGFSTSRELQARYPKIKIIILSMSVVNEQLRHLIDLGVSGYLLKNQDIDSVIDAIHTVYQNDYYFNELVSLPLVHELVQNKTLNPTFECVCLSEREIEIVQLICEEYTNKEISDRLNLSIRTIEGHRERILMKTNAKNVVGIVMYAVKHNLVQDSQKYKQLSTDSIR